MDISFCLCLYLAFKNLFEQITEQIGVDGGLDSVAMTNIVIFFFHESKVFLEKRGGGDG